MTAQLSGSFASAASSTDQARTSTDNRRASVGGRRSRFLLRLVIGCLGPLVIAVVCQATYTVLTQRRMVEQALADKASSLSALMVDVAGPSMLFEDRKSVADALGFAAADPDFRFSLALDSGDKVIAYRGPENERQTRIAQATLTRIPRLESRLGVVVASHPVTSDGKFVGVVQVALRTDRAAAHVRHLSLIAALISLAGIAAAILVVLALARRIARRNRDMAILLDSVEQGFLGVDASGTLAIERSAVAAAWLGPYQPGQKLWAAIAAVDATAGKWIELGWGNLLDSGMPVDICLDQLPKRLTIGERTVRMEVKPLMLGVQLRQALVLLSDITTEIERQRAEAMGRDLVAILERLAHDKAGLLEFLEDAESLVQRIDRGLRELGDGNHPEEFRRDLHTLKGNCAVFGLSHIAACCHDLEERLSSGAVEGPDAGEALFTSWRVMHGKLFHILGAKRSDVLELHLEDIGALEHRLLAGATAPELLHLVQAWRLEPLSLRLERYATEAREIARRLGRGEIQIEIDAAQVRLEREKWLPFWRVFGHVLRNAIDHGLEPPPERVTAGKFPTGTIHMRAAVTDGRLVIEVEDDGRGVDWPRVAERARGLGLPWTRPEDLVNALFAEGLSTKEGATETSGRGVGLSAVRAGCLQLGVDVSVTSELGRGTVMRFSWPASGPAPAVRDLTAA